MYVTNGVLGYAMENSVPFSLKRMLRVRVPQLIFLGYTLYLLRGRYIHLKLPNLVSKNDTKDIDNKGI